jgi:hypothetical protein
MNRTASIFAAAALCAPSPAFCDWSGGAYVQGLIGVRGDDFGSLGADARYLLRTDDIGMAAMARIGVAGTRLRGSDSRSWSNLNLSAALALRISSPVSTAQRSFYYFVRPGGYYEHESAGSNWQMLSVGSEAGFGFILPSDEEHGAYDVELTIGRAWLDPADAQFMARLAPALSVTYVFSHR